MMSLPKSVTEFSDSREHKVMIFLPMCLCLHVTLASFHPVAISPDAAATRAWILSLESIEGGFASQPGGKPSLRATLGAIRALKKLQAKPANPGKIRSFVEKCLGPDGFADQPGGKSSTMLQAIGLMVALDTGIDPASLTPEWVRLEMSASDFEGIRLASAAMESGQRKTAKSTDWIQFVETTMHKGQAGDIRLPGGAVAALLRLGVEKSQEEKMALVKLLIAGSKADGSWGHIESTTGDLDSSYRILRAVVMLGGHMDGKTLKRFIARCRHSGGGYSVQPGKPATVSATYQALTLLEWLK